MSLCGFHGVIHVQVEDEELWLNDAIEHETVELIIWNLMAKHQRRLRMGLTLHPAYNSLGQFHLPSRLRSGSSLSMPFGWRRS